MTHKNTSHQPCAINLFALPYGGYEIRDPNYRDVTEDRRGQIEYSPLVACFSTLGEALDWLNANMARPVPASMGRETDAKADAPLKAVTGAAPQFPPNAAFNGRNLVTDASGNLYVLDANAGTWSAASHL